MLLEGHHEHVSRASQLLGLPHNLLDPLQKRFARKNHVFSSLDKPLLPDDSLRIDQEEGPLWEPELGQRLAGGSNAVLPDHLQVWPVTEHWIR